MSKEPLSTIKAISFDAGHTLLRATPSITHHYREVLKKAGSRKSPSQIDLIVTDTLETFERKMFQEDLMNEASDDKEKARWAQVDQVIARKAEVTEDPKSVADQIWERFLNPDHWEPYPETERVLGVLRKSGYKVGVLSNWSTGLRAVLAYHKLEPLLDFTIISAEVGIQKPSAKIFQLAAMKAGVPIENLLHVGDQPEADFHGARAAGAKAALVGRQRAEGVDDDMVLGNLREIFMILWEDRYGRYGKRRKPQDAEGQREVLRMWGEE